MKRIKYTIIVLLLINAAFYGPSIVRELLKDAEQAGTEYSEACVVESSDRVSIYIYRQVTLSQRQIDSIKNVEKVNTENLMRYYSTDMDDSVFVYLWGDTSGAVYISSDTIKLR
jgi:hypothetical protein